MKIQFQLAASKFCAFIVLSLLGGCGGSSGSGDELITIDQWRQDIDTIVDRSITIHPNLFHSISSMEYRSLAEDLKRDLPNLTKNEIFLGIKKLMAAPALREDGHTLVPMFQATGFRLFPLRLYEFEDGVFVIDASAPHRDSIGKRVVQIGGVEINELNRLIDPTITRDNEMTTVQKRTLHYLVPEFLQALGVLVDANIGDFLLEDENGNFSTLLLAPIDKEDYRAILQNTVGLPEQPAPLYLSNLTERFWLQVLEDGSTLYIKYNLVLANTQSQLTIADFSDLIRLTVSNPSINKVVVDIRHNGGGDNSTFGPLINVLLSNEINQPNKLFVLTDRLTYSAAANFAGELDIKSNAVFVGEMTGGSPNNYGDTTLITLPNSGYGIAIPTRYWRFAPANSQPGVSPDIAITASSGDYFNRRDPVLEAVLNM